MESSKTPDAAPGSDPMSAVQTSESLVLQELFPSRSSLLQYVSGMMDADGSIGVFKRGAVRFSATVRFHQSIFSNCQISPVQLDLSNCHQYGIQQQRAHLISLSAGMQPM